MDVNLRDAWDAVPLYYACRSGKRLARHCQVDVVMLDDRSGNTQTAELGSQQALSMIYTISLLLHYTLLQLHHSRLLICAAHYWLWTTMVMNGCHQRQHLGLQLACIIKQSTALQAHL